MKNCPLIAVIITCFNYEQFVDKAIRSVVEQKIDACEIIVIDDGSSDESWAVIQSLAVPAFRTSNRGQREACLYGLGHTQAPFILFLDADDELAPGSLKRILEVLDPSVAKLQFCLTCIDGDGQVIADPYPALEAFRGSDRIVDEILRSGVYQTPPTSGNVFRRDVCEILRQCDYDNAVDGVILTLAPFMGDVVSLSESLGRYRVHGQNDSGIGCIPQALTLKRDLNRFRLRMKHLRDLLSELRPGAILVRSENTFYFQTIQFILTILGGARVDFKSFLLLLRSIFTEPRSLKWKAANAAFSTAMFLATYRFAQALIAFRFAVGRRSFRKFLHFARRPS